ncbi:hypothetical protein M758_9G089500 [Ceratodon purpureus]|nr:hypothetical protein M758_9G089500 [Ceratodon purpureus]
MLVMDQHQWLVFILLPLLWSISLKQIDSARLLQTQTSQKNTWPWYSILPPIGQPLLSGATLPNLLNFSLPNTAPPPAPSPPPPSSPPPFSFPKFPLPPLSAPKFPSLPPLSAPKFPSLPPLSAPKFPSLPPFSAPKFPSIPPISQPGFSFPPFSQPKPTLPSVPPSSLPGKPDKSPGWQLTLPPFPQPTLPKLTLPPFPQPTLPKFPAWGPSSWSTPSPPPPSSPPPSIPSFPWTNPTPSIPSFPWTTPSSPPPSTPSFPWNNPSPPLPTTPSFPWNTPSPPPPSTPSFPWDKSSPSPPLPTLPTFPWNTPSPPPPSGPSFPWNTPSPPPLTTPTIPTIPVIPVIPIIPSLPWNTPSPPPTTPSFPWNTPSPPPPTFPTLPWLTTPSPPPTVVGSTLPPFGLPPGGPLFPNGIQFTFSNFTNSWLPEAGVKVTWESIITIELSLQLLVEALFKPITLIIQQFDSTGPGSWGWKNGLTESKLSADVGATCTTLGKNGFPEKGLIIVQTPIDNTVDTAVTWFTVLFNGWSKDTPFNATLDHTPGTFGGFVTNATSPNLKSFCSHPGALNRVAAKQGQYVLN